MPTPPPPNTTTKKITNTDAQQARISLSLSLSRALVSSWLPPPTPVQLAAQKSDEQLIKEDEELFAPLPPRLGLGAPVPKEFLGSEGGGGCGGGRVHGVNGNDLLKRRIMGRVSSGSRGSNPMPAPKAKRREAASSGDDDEEEGRSSLGRRKKAKAWDEGGSFKSPIGATSPPSPVPAPAPLEKEKRSPTPPTRFGTYLDAHQAQKRRKKKKKHAKPTSEK